MIMSDGPELYERNISDNINNIFLSKSVKFFLVLFIIYLIYYIINNKNNIKVCLCVIGKKENLYAAEYVQHYKKLGYKHIFIYDNNDINDERFEDVLNNEILNNFVTIINYRGYRGINNHPQFDSYIDCYRNNNKKYDWLSFFDFDEFLYISNNKTINLFLNDKIFNECINIKINWLMYSDNDLMYYENKPIQERFTKFLLHDPGNNIIKSTIRGNLKTNYWDNMENPHTSNNDYISCNSLGIKISSRAYGNIPPTFKNAFIKHYATKSIEEYCKKIKRGRADLKRTLNKKTIREVIKYFFTRNKFTEKKLNYFKKMFNYTYDFKFKKKYNKD